MKSSTNRNHDSDRWSFSWQFDGVLSRCRRSYLIRSRPYRSAVMIIPQRRIFTSNRFSVLPLGRWQESLDYRADIFKGRGLLQVIRNTRVLQ